MRKRIAGQRIADLDETVNGAFDDDRGMGQPPTSISTLSASP